MLRLKFTIAITIRGWIAKAAIWPVLLYRQLRYGYTFRLIRMSQPRYAKVDPADYKRLRRYEWSASKNVGKCFYARGHTAGGKAKVKLIYLHNEVIKVPDGMVVDHINHDGMDNRSANLRAATYSQNMCHRRKRSDAKTSKYKGVSWKKKTRKWVARIEFEKKKIHIGYFRSEIDAAKAYDRAAIKYHGEFASLNFPESAVRRWRRGLRI